MTPTLYAVGAAAGDRAFIVEPNGERAWIVREDAETTGRIETQPDGTLLVSVDDTGAEHDTCGADLHYAVTAFADLTRTVRATPQGRTLAATWQSSDPDRRALDQLANSGRARLDRLRAAAERAVELDVAAADHMDALLTFGLGLNPETAWLAAQTMGQILDDIERGAVPADVPDFSTLHDYVDANLYGTDFGTAEEVAPLQAAVDAWIRSGGIVAVLAGEAPDPRDGTHDVEIDPAAL